MVQLGTCWSAETVSWMFLITDRFLLTSPAERQQALLKMQLLSRTP